jgi:hypothetical protein
MAGITNGADNTYALSLAVCGASTEEHAYGGFAG